MVAQLESEWAYVISMIMRVDFANSYRLNQMLSFILMALWA